MSLAKKLEKFRSDEPDTDELLTVLNRIDPEEIVTFCGECLTKPTDASFGLRISLLSGLTVARFRIKIIRMLLHIVFEDDDDQIKVSETVENDIVGQLLLHFDEDPKLTSGQLQQLITIGQSEIKSRDTKFKSKWFPIMSKLLSLCLDHDKMPQLSDDHEISGSEFRFGLIRNLCIKNLWKGDNLPALVSMFREISHLANNELDEIFSNLLEVEVKNLEPEQMPPVVYQILLLTTEHPSFIGRFVSLLANFYNKAVNSDAIEDSESMDIIGSSRFSVNTIKRSQSITMVHINTEARTGHPIVKEVLKLLKSALHVPEIVANPFTLNFCLSLTSLKHYRQPLVESLKGVINKVISSHLRKKNNAWFSDEIREFPDCQELLTEIIKNTCSYGSWELIGDGIVDLALIILDINAGLGGKPDAKLRKMWDLAQIILKTVVKLKTGVAEVIIKQLSKRIMYSKAAPRYTDTVKHVIAHAQGELLNKTGILHELLDQVSSLNYSGGKRVLLALIPVIKISTAFRDQTILVIRKALFSPRIETRRIAINGVLALLKYFKISSGALSNTSTQTILSQSSSGLSQVAADVHRGRSVSYEALCLELLGVLKRGFTAQVGVRMSLYQGLYDVVVRNPELCPKVLQMLHQHAIRMGLNNATDSVCPIDVHDLVKEQDDQAIVKDPIGWLIHCIQLLVSKAEHIYGDDDLDSDPDLEALPKLQEMLEALAKKFADMDLNDMNIDRHIDCNKASVTGQANNLKVESLKNCYEALMEYIITHGADKDASKSRLILQLMTKHHDLQEAQRSSGGSKEKGAKKKKNENKDDTIAKAKKAPPPPFELPEHAFSLKALSVVLNMILLDKHPDHHVAVSELKSSDKFVAYIYKVCKEKLTSVDKILTVNGNTGVEGSDVILGHLRSIALVFVNYAVKANAESEDSLLLPSIEALMQVVKIVAFHFNAKKEDFFKVLDVENSESSNDVLIALIECCKVKLTLVQDNIGEEEEDEADIDACKTIGGYFKLMEVLLSHIQSCSDKSEQALSSIYDWMKRYCEQCPSNTAADVFKPAADLYFKMDLRTKTHTNLFKELAFKIKAEIGILNESATQAEESSSIYGFVTEKTGETVFSLMLPYLESMIDVCDTMIQRCKQLCADPNAAKLVDKSADLSRYEANVCNNLSRIVIATLQLCQTKFKTFEPLIKLIMRIFTSMDNLAKHFLVRIKRVKTAMDSAKFDSLVKHVAKELTPKVYDLITFINDSNTSNAGGKGKKKKEIDPTLLKARVLRETRNIPNLIAKLETFMGNLQKLASKGKCERKLLEGIKLGTARDFRLKLDAAPQPEEVLDASAEDSMDTVNADGDTNENEENQDISNAQAESTRLDHSSVMDLTNIPNSQSQQSQSSCFSQSQADTDAPPPSKKLKVKMSFSKPNPKS